MRLLYAANSLSGACQVDLMTGGGMIGHKGRKGPGFLGVPNWSTLATLMGVELAAVAVVGRSTDMVADSRTAAS